MDQQIRFCTTSDGLRIAYAVVGEGPPLVLVRGWVSHIELDWQMPVGGATLQTLAQHFRVIRFDKRGTGLSDRDVTDFSLESRLRDLEAVVDAVKLKRFGMQAYSEGGPIAIAYAAAHPRQVTRLSLLGTYARGATLGKEDVRDALIALVRAEWGLGSDTLSSIFMPGASSEEHALFTRYQRAAASREGAAAMLEANYAVDVSGLLARIKIPTLVMHARGDRAVPFEHGRELAGRISGARFRNVLTDEPAVH
jgi:pimeloyl-ACP methyl ester carboxylesterase